MAKSKHHEEMKSKLGQNVYLLSRIMANIASNKARPYGLGSEQLLILSAINIFPKNISDIATILIKDKTTISREVNALCNKGFCKKIKDVKDGRVVYVKITPSGLDVLRSMKRSMGEIKQILESCISEEENEICTQILSKIITSLESIKEEN